MSGPADAAQWREARLRTTGPVPEWTGGELNMLTAEHARTPADVAELVSRHTSLFFAWKASQREVKACKTAVDAARRADEHARAEALAAGKPAPKATLPAAEAKLADAERVADDHRRALALTEQRIRDAAARHADDWRAAIDADEHADQVAIADALDTVAGLIGRRDVRRRIRRIVADPHGMKAWTTAVPDTDERGALDRLRGALHPRPGIDAGDQPDPEPDHAPPVPVAG